MKALSVLLLSSMLAQTFSTHFARASPILVGDEKPGEVPVFQDDKQHFHPNAPDEQSKHKIQPGLITGTGQSKKDKRNVIVELGFGTPSYYQQSYSGGYGIGGYNNYGGWGSGGGGYGGYRNYNNGYNNGYDNDHGHGHHGHHEHNHRHRHRHHSHSSHHSHY